MIPRTCDFLKIFPSPLVVAVLLCGLLLPLAPAGGQESGVPAGEDGDATAAAAGEPFGEEIMVTARRREENVQTIPISITTFDGTALEERSMADLAAIGDFTPNLDFSTTGGFGTQTSEATVMIRGIGQIDTAIYSDPAVGIYVDGVFLARAQGGVLDLLDLERVEVLRGPQGTLFGKNTTGGALSLVTRKPSNDFSALLQGTLGEFERRDVRASVSGALSDKVSASLAFLATNRDGFTRSLASGERFFDDDRQSARLALRFAPSDSLTVDWSADGMRERETGGDQILLSLTATDLLLFYNNAQVLAGRQPVTEELWVTGSLYESFSTSPSYNDGDVFGTALTVNWLASTSLNLHSITAYRGFEFDTGGDLDGTPLAVAEVSGPIKNDQFSQEIHLSGAAAEDRLTWLVGGLYFREKPRSVVSIDIMTDLFPALEAAPGPIVSPPGVPPFLCNPGPPPPGLPCFGGAGNPLNLAFFNGFAGLQTHQLETESWALFTEGTYDVSPKLSATFGLRYSLDEKTFQYTNVNAFGIVDSDLFNEDEWDALTPRVSLAYQARQDLLVYFTASRGYKSGGFNGRPQQRQQLDPFDPEIVMSYEVGLKSDWLDRRLRLNGAVFFSDYDDIQFAASFDVGGTPVFITQNAGRAEITGFELELSSRPAQGLDLSANVGYTHTELVELDPRVPPGLREGGTLPKAPEWTANAAVQHTFQLGDSAVLIPRLDYVYRGKVFNNIANTEEIAQDAYDLLNVRLLYGPASGSWDIAAFVTNLTDEEFLDHGLITGSFGFNIGIPGRPREWGLTAQYRF